MIWTVICPVRKTPFGGELIDLDQASYSIENVREKIEKYKCDYPTVAAQYPVLRIVEVEIAEVTVFETFPEAIG